MVISLAQIQIFMLILARIVGMVLSAPILNAKSIPATIKLVIAIWFAIALWFVVPLNNPLPTTFITFFLVVVIEVFIGYIIGYIANIMIQSIQAAGDIADVQMGLSVANILSPTTGLMTSIIGSLTFYIALAIFLVVNGHHMVFSAVYQSFTALPAAGIYNFGSEGFIVQFMELIKFFWLTALRLAAPSVLLIFLSDFTFGIVSRVAPQVNVFMLGFQVKPSLGLFGLLISISLFTKQVSNIVATIGVAMQRAFIVLK